MIIRRESLDRIPVDKESSFVVDTRGASFFDHSISILGPGNRAVAPTVTGDSSSGFKVSFTPSEVGDHLIDVKVAGDSIPPCPFMAKVYDANNVKISDINTGTVSKPVFFTSKSFC
jgi:filamin